MFFYYFCCRHEYGYSDIWKLARKVCLSMDVFSSEGTKLKFREVEKVALKICLLNSHLSFDETCLNIYIYLYYVYIYSIEIKRGRIFDKKIFYTSQKNLNAFFRNSEVLLKFCSIFFSQVLYRAHRT